MAAPVSFLPCSAPRMPGDPAADGRKRAARPRLTVVMPAHDEADGIAGTLHELAATLSTLEVDWDVLVVDDGSTDATARVVAELDPGLRTSLLRLSRNFGKEAALTAGLDHAAGEVIACMDADGQHPASLLAPMLERWRDGYDMVYAVISDRHGETAYKRLGSRFFYRLIRRSGDIDIPANAGDFRLMDRCVVDALRKLPEHNRFMKGLYAWVGFRSIGIPYTPLERTRGQSSFSRLKLASLAWSGITSFSVLPLRAASVLGALLATIAFSYGIYELIQSLVYGTDVPGWPTVVVGMMFLSGVQLLFIGILGEYLARVYDEVKGRPTYVVAEWVRGAGEGRTRSRNPPREHAPG